MKVVIRKDILRKIIVVLPIILCAFILVLSVRGKYGNPSIGELSTPEWQTHGPLELSPDRGRYALLYSVIEDKSIYFSVDIARFAKPDLGYKNGNYVSLFAPGVTLLLVPGYILGKYIGISQVGAFLVISLIALFNFVLIVKICEKLGIKKSIATLCAFAFLFATPAFSYAVTIYQHHVTSFLILLSLYALLKWEDYKALLVVWFCAGLSLSVDYPNLFIMFPLCVYALGRIITIKLSQEKVSLKLNIKYSFTLFIVILPALIFFGFNYLSYGSPFQIAGTVTNVRGIDEQGNPSYDPKATPNSVEEFEESTDRSAVNFFKTRNLLNGFYILFLSPDRGIAMFAPWLFLGFIAGFLLYKLNNSIYKLILSIICMNVLVYSLWDDPWGGWAFGSRYLIPAYCLLSILIAWMLSNYGNKILWILFCSLFAYSAYVNTLGALTTNAMPPKIEVLSLEQLSGKEEKYTYTRNQDLINANVSKSFVFETFLRRSITASTYFYLVYFLILGGFFTQLVNYRIFERKTDD